MVDNYCVHGVHGQLNSELGARERVAKSSIISLIHYFNHSLVQPRQQLNNAVSPLNFTALLTPQWNFWDEREKRLLLHRRACLPVCHFASWRTDWLTGWRRARRPIILEVAGSFTGAGYGDPQAATSSQSARGTYGWERPGGRWLVAGPYRWNINRGLLVCRLDRHRKRAFTSSSRQRATWSKFFMSQAAGVQLGALGDWEANKKLGYRHVYRHIHFNTNGTSWINV